MQRGFEHRQEPNEGLSGRFRALFSSSGAEPYNASSSSLVTEGGETSTLGSLLEMTLSRLWGEEHFDSHGLKKISKSFPEGGESDCFFSSISRIEQLETWDCGIVAVLILLRWVQRSDSLSILMSDEEVRQYHSLRNYIQTQSIWTADLVDQLQSLLQGSECRFLFCSKTFQVDESYQDVRYYQETFRADEVRVSSLFGKLVQNIPDCMLCSPEGFATETILKATCHPTCIAMVLVDNSILHPSRRSLEPTIVQYVGHYVVLCGISHDPEHMAIAQDLEGDEGRTPTTQSEKDDTGDDGVGCVVLCDPGQDRPPLSFVTRNRFERARMAKGTDEDIVFILR